MNQKESDIYIALADLFFLDQDLDDVNLQNCARIINEYGWGKEKIKTVLITIIAPLYAFNIGYGIIPYSGIWDGFDPKESVILVTNRIQKIQNNKIFFPWFKKKFYQWLLNELNWEKLLAIIIDD